MVTQFQKYADNPRQLLLDARALRVKAMRQALVGKVPATIKPENLIVDDEIEIDSRPVGREGQVRRLFSSRLALHAASRVETRIQVRQFALALLVMLVVMVAGTATFSMDRQGLATQYALGGAFFSLLLWGGWLIYRALGLSARGFAGMMGAEVLADADLRDARDFADRVLVRATPTDAPADLQDVYRPLTVDAQGQPVDGQVVSSDYAGRYLVNALENGLPIYALAGLALIGTAIVGLYSPALGALISMPVAIAATVWSGLRLFILPTVTSQRAIEAQEALRRSPTAKLVDQAGPSSFIEIEQAKVEQVAEAIRDTTPLIPLGTSLGLLSDRRDPFAPSHAGLLFGLSVSDLSTHVLNLGSTGSGKTTGVLRPLIDCWAKVKAGGTVVLDGKGVLPADVSDLPGFHVITPGGVPYAPIENLGPDEVADSLHKMFGSDTASDPHWQDAAREYIRSAAKTLYLLAGFEYEMDRRRRVRFEEAKEAGEAEGEFQPAFRRWKWTLASLYELAMVPSVLPDVRRVIEGETEAEKAVFAQLKDDYLRAYIHFSQTFPAEADGPRTSVLSIVGVWLGTLVNNSALADWVDCEEGVEIEDALYGRNFGLLLPEFRYGRAGAVISNFAKRRFYEAVKRRGESWVNGNGTRVMLVVDEVQSLLSGGADDAEVLPIARSLGLSVVWATQNIDGLQIALKDQPALLEQILGQFRSVIALKVNTTATCEFIAARMGTTSRPIYSDVPAPVADAAATVSGMQLAAGAYSAGTLMDSVSTTPEIVGLRGRGLAGEAVDMLGKLAEKTGLEKAYKLLPAALREGEKAGTTKLGTHENLTAAEVRNLTARKFTALAVVNRAGVDRRDLIKLNPVFSFAKEA
ncbi:TPA: TraM recognition domain-containing protein [Pseudomonas aeruginosa]|uniref:TraM recognition domain-containing protein n=1 Tax=Pseudomonas aeruginosa TaxID=287 RepID=UPI000940966C|nr:TraM recognition domain-containing protein [Pseudomonas aeruginosa]OKS33357.1 hypothetical protein BH608_18025 [Pseudomonas aeruginosa]HBO7934633.1 TraM recognition domain-containing protein [Pseudomonas aeruginosa]HBO8188575.1 TraM recognition domain-containing protein [Pseudomonas aeruginosa]HBO8713824.1 TraM recognition domain-containing protein [Pseudomonas aeruginosa]